VLALVQDHGDQKSGNHIECLNCNNAREQPDPQDGASRRVRDHDTERQQKSDKATSRPPHSAINARVQFVMNLKEFCIIARSDGAVPPFPPGGLPLS